MNLHEYQAKALFAEYGLPVSTGYAVDTADEAVAADAPGWRVERPVSIGARGGVWGSDYTAGGVGGGAARRTGG